ISLSIKYCPNYLFVEVKKGDRNIMGSDFIIYAKGKTNSPRIEYNNPGNIAIAIKFNKLSELFRHFWINASIIKR
ncbi:hypothetical protein D9Z51_23440, partial [Salmonella enterica]|nr:hypothetical protein [Salmonella enterica]